MTEYAWLDNGTNSHFMIGYKGSQGDGGDPSSWPMLYNALWLRWLAVCVRPVQVVPAPPPLVGPSPPCESVVRTRVCPVPFAAAHAMQAAGI
jgi:hypothetical protein